MQKRIILNNLFTTLQCQRTNNLRQARSRKAGEQRKVVEPTKKSLYIRRMANLATKSNLINRLSGKTRSKDRDLLGIKKSFKENNG